MTLEGPEAVQEFVKATTAAAFRQLLEGTAAAEGGQAPAAVEAEILLAYFWKGECHLCHVPYTWIAAVWSWLVALLAHMHACM